MATASIVVNKKGKLSRKAILIWQVLLVVMVVVLLFGTIRKDRDGLTAFDHIQDVLTADDWIGWIHPLGEEVSRITNTGPFYSQAECESASHSQIQKYFEGGWEKAKFYCGYRCSATDANHRAENCKLVK